MASYAAEVERDERWKIVLWIREMQKRVKVAADSVVAEDSIFGPSAAEGRNPSPPAAEPLEGVAP